MVNAKGGLTLSAPSIAWVELQGRACALAHLSQNGTRAKQRNIFKRMRTIAPVGVA